MSFWSGIWNGVKSVFGSVGGQAVSSAAGLVSNKIQMKYQQQLMKDQYNYNVKLADKNLLQSKALQQFQNDYTTKMANSAHQIEVNDLRKAGLNPILSATGGNGADFSAGGATISSGTASGATAPNVDLLSSALAYRQQKNQNKVADATASQLDDLGANLRSQTRGQAWKNMQEQFAYDYIQPLQKALYEQQINDIKNQIKNRDAATAGMLKRYEAMNFSDIFNAYTGRLVGSANAYNTKLQSAGLKADNDFFSSSYGKFIRGLGHTTGAIGNVFKGGYSYSGK